MNQPDRARRLCAIPLFAVAITLVVSLALPSIARAQSSSDATLKSLSLSGITFMPDFDPAVTNYTANVENSVSSTIPTAETNDDGAAAGFSPSGAATSAGDFMTVNLGVGENIIDTVVAAEDGTTILTYRITITRAAPPPSLGTCPTATASQETVCNLKADVTGGISVGHRFGNHDAYAFRFTTGDASDGYELSSVYIYFSEETTGAPGNIVVEIYEEASGVGGGVGDLAGTLSGENPDTPGVHEFTASDIALAPSANYFLAVSAPDAMSGNNYYRLGDAFTGGSSGSDGWSILYEPYSKRGDGAFMSEGGTSIGLFAVVADIFFPPVNPPRNVRAEPDPMDATQIVVTWELPSGGGDPTHYDVCILAAPMEINDANCTGTEERTSGPGNHRQAAASTPKQTHTRMGLTADIDYNIAVRAIGLGIDNNSDWAEVRRALRLKLRVFLESALP